MKKTIFVLSLFLCSLCLFQSSAKAKGKKVGGFYYTYKTLTSSTCQITKVSIVIASNIKDMEVPDTIDGKRVVKMGAIGDIVTSCYGPNVLGMYPAEEGDGYWPEKVEIYSRSIKNIILPQYLKEITRNCFSFLPGLEKIYIPAKFSKTAEYLCDMKWTSFKISKKNKHYKVSSSLLLSKSGKTVYGMVGKKTYIVIPKGVKKIWQYAFQDCNVKKISLPSSINSIGYRAFKNKKIVELAISKKNNHYAIKGDCLYSKKSGRLVAAINRNGKLIIPEGIKKMKKGISSIGGMFRNIIFSTTIESLMTGWCNEFFDQSRALNYGTFTFKGLKAPVIEQGALSAHTIYVPAKSYNAYYKEVHRGPLERTTEIITVK